MKVEKIILIATMILSANNNMERLYQYDLKMHCNACHGTCMAREWEHLQDARSKRGCITQKTQRSYQKL